MLRSVIEDYLTSSKEIQLFLPFIQLLELLGFHDIHLLHGPTEFGKDIIAKMKNQSSAIQYSFQIKVGDVNLNRFRSEIKPQLIEALTNKLSHPNFDRSLPYQVVFVTSGIVQQPATIEFQEFNRFVEDKLKATPIVTWEKQKLVSDFLTIGIDPFFILHRTPEFAGRFFKFYSQITDDEYLSFFDIESYSNNWLKLDWSNPINRLQILFEAYYFSKLLLDKAKFYESSLVLASLIRIMIKQDIYPDHQKIIQEYLDEILIAHFNKAKLEYHQSKPYLFNFEGVFSIFYHPLSCLHTLELLSLYILTSPNVNKDIEVLFLKMIDEQKGSYRIIGDNYAVSIVLITLTLLKLKEIDRLKRYLNNVCVWLCDRHNECGIATIGSDLQDTMEQLLSESLEGLTVNKNISGFAACACLDMAYILKDKVTFENIANDFRASEIILEFYHILNEEALFVHDDRTIVTSTENNYSLEYIDDYTQMISYERKSNNISIRNKSLLFLTFLLRDRYFPTFIADAVN
jgi:hypothetical protein